ncbi:hypothetical protein [Geoalkalibacter halelectricus]|uniref:hypothetical protein n=1 Tax=Geoalkalibacter halelectricus TaxID=2847045 RepID=UPI00266F5562|nr:hypothetical protein [Geoalkalibacter halelectricus]MDO3380343.1 hypothetical protein [Geoalkalibacter halelectricus]
MSKSGGGTDAVMVTQVGEMHPKGLFDAISYIEQNFANELGGAIIREEFLTTKQRLEFFEVGFRSSFISGILLALLAPLAIGAVEQHIPLFGSADPTLFDLMFAFLLAIGFSLGYAVFLGSTCTKYIGPYTGSMVKNLLSGVLVGSFLKMVVAFLFFHFIYMVVMTDERLNWLAHRLYDMRFTQDTVTAIYFWLVDFRVVFLTSAWFIVATTLLFMAIPVVSIFLASRRNKRLFASGVVRAK